MLSLTDDLANEVNDVNWADVNWANDVNWTNEVGTWGSLRDWKVKR
jgi:hypothetical protein